MRIPKTPPSYDDFLQLVESDIGRLGKILQMDRSPCVNGRYPHWDKLRFYTPPNSVAHIDWWHAIKLSRRSLYRRIPLWDKSGVEFVYLLVDPMTEVLHQIDLGSGGTIQMPDQITNPDTRDRYYVSSLIDEAITSSQIEGAATTRIVAKEMIRTGRQPRNKSEKMILNNYLAMREIAKLKHQPLTKELVFQLHRIVTQGTLDDPTAAGRFRRADEDIHVESADAQVLHSPPSAATLEDRMEAMCEFANGETPEEFLHPAIRSIILHFWLAYDHPFVDGNGRTARALFYWSMLRNKYWLFEFVSISQIIRKGLSKYGRAFLLTETDENDLTYFIRYHLYVIQRAIRELHRYIQRKADEVRAVETELRALTLLNHRQRTLISHALRHPQQRYTVESHRVSHNVVYETARSDLKDLEARGLFSSAKVGKAMHFIPDPQLAERLAAMSPS